MSILSVDSGTLGVGGWAPALLLRAARKGGGVDTGNRGQKPAITQFNFSIAPGPKKISQKVLVMGGNWNLVSLYCKTNNNGSHLQAKLSSHYWLWLYVMLYVGCIGRSWRFGSGQPGFASEYYHLLPVWLSTSWAFLNLSLFGSVVRMFVFPPNSYVENRMLKMMVLSSGTFERWFDHDGGALMNRISALLEETWELAQSLLPYEVKRTLWS